LSPISLKSPHPRSFSKKPRHSFNRSPSTSNFSIQNTPISIFFSFALFRSNSCFPTSPRVLRGANPTF
jgi:hypothetical protein